MAISGSEQFHIDTLIDIFKNTLNIYMKARFDPIDHLYVVIEHL